MPDTLPQNAPGLPQAPIAAMDADRARGAFGARMIHRLDRPRRVRLCPVPSDLGRTRLSAHGLSGADPAGAPHRTDGRALEGFEALSVFGRQAGGRRRCPGALRPVPRPLRRRLSARAAANRDRRFGRSSYGAIPDPAVRARLIG
jgi:predicted DCC family thiol-disulfide oxidoreductase YuxK